MVFQLVLYKNYEEYRPQNFKSLPEETRLYLARSAYLRKIIFKLPEQLYLF